MKVLEVTAAIIRQNGKILICQRPADKSCDLLWEFPGGKIEAEETGEQCVIRECREELGITLSVERKLTDITYEYPDRTVHLHFYLCDIVAGIPEKKEHNAIVWITPDEVDQYEFCPADQEMLKRNILRKIFYHKWTNNYMAPQQKAAVPFCVMFANFCVISWTSFLVSGLIVLPEQQEESKKKIDNTEITKNQHRSFIAVMLIFCNYSFVSSKSAISQFSVRDNKSRCSAFALLMFFCRCSYC